MFPAGVLVRDRAPAFAGILEDVPPARLVAVSLPQGSGVLKSA
jgi:hypothetical protein